MKSLSLMLGDEPFRVGGHQLFGDFWERYFCTIRVPMIHSSRRSSASSSRTQSSLGIMDKRVDTSAVKNASSLADVLSATDQSSGVAVGDVRMIAIKLTRRPREFCTIERS
jgi:hypothetical protein